MEIQDDEMVNNEEAASFLQKLTAIFALLTHTSKWIESKRNKEENLLFPTIVLVLKDHEKFRQISTLYTRFLMEINSKGLKIIKAC